jgi:cell wall-associated NlpC family hydrolase
MNAHSSNLITLNLLALFLLSLLGGCSSTREPSTRPLMTNPNAVHSEVVTIAREQVGTPYHYGGDTPKQGFDCSGLVYYSHLQVGVRLPRTSYGQYKATQPVSLRHLHPGDLVFFSLSRHKINHVGIYIGNQAFIHSPSAGKEVTIDLLSDPYWQRRFVRGGRTL